MLLVLVPAALAAPLRAKIDNKPFVPVTVLAGLALTGRGAAMVMLSDTPMGCDDLGYHPSEDARSLLFTFPDTRPGTISDMTLGFTGEIGGVVTLVSMPSAAGERGRVSFAVKGKKDRISGEVEFVLCEPIAARPVMELALESVERTLSRPSPFDGELPLELKIRVALPIGWTDMPPDAGASHARFVGPDRQSELSLFIESPMDDLAVDGRAHAKASLAGVRSAPNDSEMRSHGMVGTDAYAFHQVYLAPGYGPWRHHLVVFRREAAWPLQVHCDLETDEAGAAVLIEPIRAACAGIEWIP